MHATVAPLGVELMLVVIYQANSKTKLIIFFKVHTVREGQRKVGGIARAGPESTQHLEGFEVLNRKGSHCQFFICQLFVDSCAFVHTLFPHLPS